MKYLIILTVYCLFLLTPFGVAKNYFEDTYSTYAVKRKSIKLAFENNTESYILGSSHAGSLKEEILENHFNFQISKQNSGGSDLFEIIYQIKTIKNNHRKPTIFFIAISPFMFHLDNNSYLVNGIRTRREKRIRLYAIYQNYKTLINRDYKNYFLSFFHSIITPNHSESFVHFDKVKSIFLNYLMPHSELKKETYNQEAKCSNTLKEEELIKHAEIRVNAYFKHRLIPNMQTNADYSIPERAFTQFYEVINSNKNDIFILYSPPFWSNYYDNIPTEFTTYVNRAMKEMQRLPNVQYYEYSALKQVVSNPCNFVNSDHLNNKGGELFTHLFIQDLQYSLIKHYLHGQ